MGDTTAATRTYRVEGMTCDHCAASVSEEVSELTGVDHVEVDLASGRLDASGGMISEGEVRAAVERAGYELASDR